MLVKNAPNIPAAEITDERHYWNRREWLRTAVGGTLATAAASIAPGSPLVTPVEAQTPLANVKKSGYTVDEPWNSYDDITGYNNFYEFGTDKDDPARNAGKLTTRPWTVKVEGCVRQAGRLRHRRHPQVVPARGARLSPALRRGVVDGDSVGGVPAGRLHQARRAARARRSSSRSRRCCDPSEMPGQRAPCCDWPYVEGLRIDEAMHPLTILAVGLYGKTLPNQNGAPLRLVVPWKYGFKSIKSIVKITLRRDAAAGRRGAIQRPASTASTPT